MTFLNSAILFALSAMSIPLIIHFLSKRRIKTIEFSSLKFLEQMQKNRMKWLKMKELILLFLRMIIIGLIVLAFARPTLRGFIGSSKASSSVVIILDRSASMDSEGDTGTLFEEAKRFAGRLIDALQPADQVSIIPFPGEEGLNSIEPINPGNLLRDKLSKIDISYRAGNIGDALKSSLEILNKSPELNREIYLLSDAQEVNWKELPPEVMKNDNWNDIHFFRIEFAPNRDDNIGVIEVKTPPQLLAPGENIRLESELENFGKGTIENVLVGAVVDGERKAQTTVSLPPGRSQTVDFDFKLDNPGFHSGYVEIGYDDFGLDNKRYFSMQIPERINLLAVSQAESDLDFTGLALNREEAGQIRYQGIAVAELLRKNLSEYDVILLQDIKSLDPAREKSLESFVSGGGGLMVALGKDSEIRYWNGFLSDLGGIDVGQQTGAGDEYIYWDQFDLDHPIFSIYSRSNIEGGEMDIPKIRINYYSNLTGGRIIGSSSAGVNLLAESTRLPLLVYGSGFDFASGDLPAHSFFLPFLVRSIEYLGSRNADIGFAGIIGRPFRWNIKSATGEVSLTAPDESEEDLRTVGASGQVFVSGEVRKEPGIYTLKSGDKTLSLTAFNVDPVESSNARITANDIDQTLNLKIAEINPKNDIKTEVTEARFGRELWKECLLLALILLIIESILGRTVPPTMAEK